MSSAASTAGYLFHSGILAQRRQAKASAQPERIEPQPAAPRQVKVTYRKRIPTER